MPGTKEIRTKIASVKSTQKITKAMQMVATSKMRRAQERMRLARPYADKMRNVIGHLTQANPDYRHPFLRRARRQGRRHHHRLHRPRARRRAECQRVQADAHARCASGRGRGRRSACASSAPRRLAFFRRLGAADPRQRRASGRPPAHQGSDRRRQGDAGCLPRRQDRPAVPGERAVHEHHDAEAGNAAAAAGRGGRSEGLQEHWDYIYEPDATASARWPADALHRVAGLSRRGRERRLGDGGAHGGHEGRLRQRRQADPANCN